jgi:diaminopimelate epimerase
MKLDFFKYQGAGNDFIIVDNRKNSFPKDNTTLIQQLCKRHFGIGSDGLILIEKSSTVDFYMEFYNPDGSQSFCGNGSRCAVLFVHHIGMIKKQCTFQSKNGENKAEIVSQDEVKLAMFDVKLNSIESLGNDWSINTGSPHYIQFQQSIDGIDIVPEAQKIRYNEQYKKQGINVNYVEVDHTLENTIKVRTYERGVEDETLACGTGVTACALAYNLAVNAASNVITVFAKGGQLTVSFEKDAQSFHSIFLQGPAKFVYKGEIDV